MNELISIIIPWYNTNIILLKRALMSICNQTDSNNIEVVICNDGSKDYNFKELKKSISQFDIPIKIVSNTCNKGISAARNMAVNNCKGSWLIWLDADDELSNDTIKIFREKMVQSQCDYFISKCIVLGKDTIEYREPKKYFMQYAKLKNTIQNPFISNIFSIQAQMIKKDVFQALGGFDSNIKYAEVTEFFLRYVWKRGTDKLKYIDEYLYRYYRNDNSHSTDRERMEFQRKDILITYAKKSGLYLKDIIPQGRDSYTGAQKYLVIQ